MNSSIGRKRGEEVEGAKAGPQKRKQQLVQWL